MMDKYGNTDSTLRGFLSRLFSNGGFAASQESMPRRLSPATVEEGRTRMRDTLLAAQNAAPAAAPPMPAAPTDSQAAAIARNNMNGPMTDATLPSSITRPRPRPRHAPAYDYAALDALTAPVTVTEGPNANIDDATRQRALAWALRNNP